MKKKALLIAPSFFSYQEMIKDEMSNQGWETTYYDERPSTGVFVKGMVKVYKPSMNIVIKSNFERILRETSDTNYDLVLLVDCLHFSGEMIKKLREKQRNAKFVLYMWDSIKNYPHVEDLIDIVDVAYSFDTEDCKKYSNLIFMPLFYGDVYKKIGEEPRNNEFQYDISSVGTAHPNRYTLYKQLEQYSQKNGIKLFLYMYLATPLLYFYNKALKKEFKNAKKSEFQFTAMNEEQIVDVFSKSKAIFDVQHHGQTGLTMRTIECLGAKKKLITTNGNVRSYDFYHPDNVCIIDNGNFDEVKSFLLSDYHEIDRVVYGKYSLKSWVKKLVE